MTKNVRRLYEAFRPDHYELFLEPDPESLTFQGRVTVSGQKTGRPSERLTFHQKDLNIISAEVIHHDKKGDEAVKISRLNVHKGFDEVRLHTAKLLYPGRYTIHMEFTGTITRPMNGIYPCFFEQDGKEKRLIATQFESHHAREVFPCIDEPEAKATFQLTLHTPPSEAVLSNTPVKHQKMQNNKQQTVFETTPKMSTYLLAFVFGDLKFLELKTKGGTLVRTWATPDNIAHTRFALECAVKTLEFYNEYYGLPYPLPKCDLIALPDFAAGAMENWGAITFREQALLVDEKNTSLPMKQYVAMVVAHELAHQWFGNLVTMRWWTDLWLNEGFASWMEYLAVDHLFPDWSMWIEFAVNEQEAGLRLDALEHTHPIEVAIHHPDEIRTIFDTISYSKGSSVLHMLHQYLGADSFRDGLRHYLKAHAYGNTDTVDLWEALETVSKKPVKAFMQSWTSQAGFPSISVMRDADSGGIMVAQERFLSNPAAQIRKHEKSLEVAATAKYQPDFIEAHGIWPVPVLATINLQPDIMDRSSQVYRTLPDWLKTLLAGAHQPKTTDLFLLNSGGAGFYRTRYVSDILQQAVHGHLQAGRLAIVDRLRLLSDALENAKADYADTTSFLELVHLNQNEDSTFVWDVMAGGLGSIRTVMNDEDLREAMKPFGRTLTAKQLARLGWESKKNESHFDTLLRPTILGLASVSEEKSVVNEALARFKAMKKPEDLPPDLRGVIYGTVARNGSQKEFNKMLRLHNTSKNSEERVTLSAALTGFKQPALIQQALSQIDSDNVRLQDASYWVAYSFMNRFARDATWQWMTTHWDWLEQNLGADMAFSRFPVYAARAYSDATFLSTYKKFFEAHQNPGLERAINQGIETIEWQSAWRTRDLATIKKYFKA